MPWYTSLAIPGKTPQSGTSGKCTFRVPRILGKQGNRGTVETSWCFRPKRRRKSALPRCVPVCRGNGCTEKRLSKRGEENATRWLSPWETCSVERDDVHLTYQLDRGATPPTLLDRSVVSESVSRCCSLRHTCVLRPGGGTVHMRCCADVVIDIGSPQVHPNLRGR